MTRTTIIVWPKNLIGSFYFFLFVLATNGDNNKYDMVPVP
jgi:hypothetical protein